MMNYIKNPLVTLTSPTSPTITASGTDPTICNGEGTINFTFTGVPPGTYDITYSNGVFEDVPMWSSPRAS